MSKDYSIHPYIKEVIQALHSGDFDGATKKCELILQTTDEPGLQAHALNAMGLVFVYQKDYPNAIGYYEQAIEKFDDSNFILNLAIAQLMTGQAEQSFITMKQCIDLATEKKPHLIIHHRMTFASYLYGVERYKETLEQLSLTAEEFMKIPNTDPTYLYNVGIQDTFEDFLDKSMMVLQHIADPSQIRQWLVSLGRYVDPEGQDRIKKILVNYPDNGVTYPRDLRALPLRASVEYAGEKGLVCRLITGMLRRGQKVTITNNDGTVIEDRIKSLEPLPHGKKIVPRGIVQVELEKHMPVDLDVNAVLSD